MRIVIHGLAVEADDMTRFLPEHGALHRKASRLVSVLPPKQSSMDSHCTNLDSCPFSIIRFELIGLEICSKDSYLRQ